MKHHPFDGCSAAACTSSILQGGGLKQPIELSPFQVFLHRGGEALGLSGRRY